MDRSSLVSPSYDPRYGRECWTIGTDIPSEDMPCWGRVEICDGPFDPDDPAAVYACEGHAMRTIDGTYTPEPAR